MRSDFWLGSGRVTSSTNNPKNVGPGVAMLCVVSGLVGRH